MLKKYANIILIKNWEIVMKKHGFSLAELLVALGIIAVGASIMMPIFLNARPDRYKFRVINCYNMASEATDALLSNPEIYYRDPNDPNDTCTGLACTIINSSADIALPANTPAACKYPLLMKELLRLGDSSTTCTNGNLEGAAPDTTIWNFSGDTTNGYTITITFPQTFGNPCNGTYSNNCKNPHTFAFHVDRNGDITADTTDRLTGVYLKNLTNIHKQDDFAELNGQ